MWVQPPCEGWTSAPDQELGARLSRLAASLGLSCTSSGMSSASECCTKGCEPGTLNQGSCGTTPTPSTGDRGEGSSISSLGARPANRIPTPASGSGKMMSVIFGPICGGSLARYDPVSSWWRTYQACLDFGGEDGESESSSDPSGCGISGRGLRDGGASRGRVPPDALLESFPRSGIAVNGQLWALQMSGPIISASGSGLSPIGKATHHVPTPTESDMIERKSTNTGGPSKGSKRPGEGGLRMALLPTPASGGNKDTYHNQISGQFRTGMNKALGLLPTPKSSPSGPDFARAGREGSGGDDLSTTLAKEMLPTPRAANPGSRTESRGGKVLAQEMEVLAGKRDAAGLLPTPRESDWRSGCSSEETRAKNSRPLCEALTPPEQKSGGSLNPTFVEWMQNWPIGWSHTNAATGGHPGLLAQAFLPSQQECQTERSDSECSGMAGSRLLLSSWWDAFQRGWTSRMRERSE